jgi:hypothetical protein
MFKHSLPRLVFLGSMLLLLILPSVGLGLDALAQAGSPISGLIVGSDTTTIRSPDMYGKPNQHRIWFNTYRNRWDALVPRSDGSPASSDHFILTDVPANQTFTPVELEDRDFGRPDTVWDNANRKLYVLSSHPVSSELWRVGYDNITDTYSLEVGALGAGVTVPGITHPNTSLGGDSPATLYVTPNGDVWVAVMLAGALLVQHSDDGGATWMPAPINLDPSVRLGVTTWIHFVDQGTTFVGVFAGEGADTQPAARYFFWYIDQNADPSVLANWINDSPNIPAPVGVEQADDHVSAARDPAGNQYFAVKTESGNPTDPLIKLFKRTPAGGWSQFKVTETQDVPEQSRPSIVIDEENAEIYIYMNGAEVVSSTERVSSRKKASLNALGDLAGAPLVPVFSMAGKIFTDVSTPRDLVNSSRDSVVLAHNRTDDTVWFAIEEIAPASTATPSPTTTPTPAATPTTVTVFADQDTYLKEKERNKNFGNQDRLPVKTKSRDSKRALYHFDLSSVPAGATILSATVHFWVERESKDDVFVHRVTDSWTEYGATWNNTAGDFDPDPEARFEPSQEHEYVSVDITSVAQEWVNGSVPNHGLMLIGEGDKESRFGSRERKKSNERPFLEVTFRP